jgi:hypothetical protein
VEAWNRKKKPVMCNSSATTSIILPHYKLPLCSGDGSRCRDNSSCVLWREWRDIPTTYDARQLLLVRLVFLLIRNALDAFLWNCR